MSCLVLVFVSAFSVTAADRVALVIGVDRYDTLPPEAQLEVAVQDATLLADTLESVDPPFQVTLLQDADWKSAQTSFDAFLDLAKNAECALIYFAGHGVEYHGENFLLVKDSDVGNISADVQRMKRRLGTGAISLQSWVDSLDASQANVKLVILDCCRDNPLQAEDGAGTRSTVGSRQGLAYSWATAYLLIISVEMAYGKHIVGKHLGFKTMWGPTMYTNTLSLPPMLTIGVLSGEHLRLPSAVWTPYLVFLVTVSCVIGVSISYTGWRARSLITATCYTVLGVANKMLTVLANAFVADDRASAVGVGCLVACLLCAAAYSLEPPRRTEEKRT